MARFTIVLAIIAVAVVAACGKSVTTPDSPTSSSVTTPEPPASSRVTTPEPPVASTGMPPLPSASSPASTAPSSSAPAPAASSSAPAPAASSSAPAPAASSSAGPAPSSSVAPAASSSAAPAASTSAAPVASSSAAPAPSSSAAPAPSSSAAPAPSSSASPAPSSSASPAPSSSASPAASSSASPAASTSVAPAASSSVAPAASSSAPAPPPSSSAMPPTPSPSPAPEPKAFDNRYPSVDPRLRAQFTLVNIDFEDDEVNDVILCTEGGPTTDCIQGTFYTNFNDSKIEGPNRILSLLWAPTAQPANKTVVHRMGFYFDKNSPYELQAVNIMFTDTADRTGWANFSAPHSFMVSSAKASLECAELTSETLTGNSEKAQLYISQITVQGDIPVQNNGRFSPSENCAQHTTSATHTTSTTKHTTTKHHKPTTHHPTTAGPTKPSHNKHKGLTPGAAAGVSIAVLIIVGGGLAFWWRKRRASRRSYNPLLEDEVME